MLLPGQVLATAVAAMSAVWSATSFEPSPESVARIETLISGSHELKFGDLESRLCRWPHAGH